MDEYIVVWSLRVKAESVEDAAIAAAQLMPSAANKSDATKIAVLTDPEVMEAFLELDSTSINLANFFEWLRTKPTIKETPNG
jgi:hypothetical protein